jgi:hypothetical protein
MGPDNPYHTVLYHIYGDKERNVYHDHNDCPDGSRIEKQHRTDGTGGRDRCKECIRKG